MSKSKSNAASALIPSAPASASRVARKSKGDVDAHGADDLQSEGLDFDDEPAVGSSPAASVGAPVDAEVEALDEEFDLGDAVAADLDTIEPAKPASTKRADDGGGDSMLSRYFREMATHHVMGPQEELATAIEVEEGEIQHWVAIFSCLPLAGYALDALERDLPTGEEALDLPQIADLRRLLAIAARHEHKLSRPQEKKWAQLTASLARAIRLADSDRLWVVRAEEAARSLGTSATQIDEGCDLLGDPDLDDENPARPRAARDAQAAEHPPVPQVRGAARANAARVEGREEQVREGEPAPRGVDRAPLQPRPLAADRSHPGGKHRPDEGGRALRPRARLPLLDVCVVVDPPRHQPRPGRQGARRAYPGAHARHAQPRRPRDAGGHRAPRERPDASRARAGDRNPPGEARQGEGLVGGDAVLARPPRGRRGRKEVHRLLAGRRHALPVRDALSHRWTDEVRRLLGTLTPIESRIIRWRFGLDDEEELTLKEIGDKYNLSRERIRQLQEQALGISASTCGTERRRALPASRGRSHAPATIASIRSSARSIVASSGPNENRT